MVEEVGIHNSMIVSMMTLFHVVDVSSKYNRIA